MKHVGLVVSAEDPGILFGPAPSLSVTIGASLSIVRACYKPSTRELRHHQTVRLFRAIASRKPRALSTQVVTIANSGAVHLAVLRQWQAVAVTIMVCCACANTLDVAADVPLSVWDHVRLRGRSQLPVEDSAVLHGVDLAVQE